jgi:hypothetical protein
VKTAGAPHRVVAKEFAGIAAGEKLRIKLRSAKDSKLPPILCGVEVLQD